MRAEEPSTVFTADRTVNVTRSGSVVETTVVERVTVVGPESQIAPFSTHRMSGMFDAIFNVMDTLGTATALHTSTLLTSPGYVCFQILDGGKTLEPCSRQQKANLDVYGFPIKAFGLAAK